MKRYLSLLMAAALSCVEMQGQVVVQFTVQQPPEFVVDGGADTTYTDGLTLGGSPTATGGGGAYDYQWEPAIWLVNASAANPMVLPLSGNTAFTLTVTDRLTGCVKQDEVLVAADISTDVDGVGASSGIRIFPNPINDQVHVQCAAGVGAFNVFSLDGALVNSQQGGADRSCTFDLGALESGLYFVSMTTADGRSLITRLCKL